MSEQCNVCCSVPQCKSIRKRNPNLTFHQFPEAGRYRVPLPNKFGEIEMEDAKKAWIMKLRIGKPITKNMRVCSLHFIENDYIPRKPGDKVKRRVLKKIAVPSCNLPLLSVNRGVCKPSTSANNSDRSQKLAACNLAKANAHVSDSKGPSDVEHLEKLDDLEEVLLKDLEAANALLLLTSKRLKMEDDSSV